MIVLKSFRKAVTNAKSQDLGVDRGPDKNLVVMDITIKGKKA